MRQRPSQAEDDLFDAETSPAPSDTLDRLTQYKAYRISFRSGRNIRRRLCQSREEAEELFAAEPSAYQLDGWAADAGGWVFLDYRDD